MVVDRAEFYTMLQRLDAFYRAPAGLQRPHGLILGDHADLEGVTAWGFDVYQNARERGATPEVAWGLVVSQIQQSAEWKALHPAPPFPAAPSRRALCLGQTTQQGLRVQTTQHGEMPWWGACWAWLTPADRKMAADQLLAHGDTICLIQIPDGPPLYDEPNQFYSADKFGPLDFTVGNTTMTAVVALVEEALLLGFTGVWLFLGGDDGARGFPIAITQTQLLGPALATSRYGNLNAYVVQVPGWDGVWHKPDGGAIGTGWSREMLAAFADEAIGHGAGYLGCEHGTGYVLAGEGAADYQPGGVMAKYAVILGEFNDGEFDDNVWQILPRMGVAYKRPPEQPAGDDPNPPNYLAGTDKYYQVFEYYIYGSVRGVAPATIAAARDRFLSMGVTHIC